jgi:LuxR family transcriptional regulator, maltose regulon positive regulatory protein
MERQTVWRDAALGIVDSDVREHPGLTVRATRPGFDLIASKLRYPAPRRGTVSRSRLVDRLAREESRPIVTVVAPPGYGKTTLLSQWAQRDERAVAWVSVDERDNDPKLLLSYVAAGLNRVQPVGERVFEALASPVSSVPGSVVPRLGAAFWSMTTPVVLVLDDVHLLHDTECRSALSVLADHVPPGSRLVLASRDEPPLRIARLRTEGQLLEIGPADLALGCEDAAALLRAAGVTLSADDVATLHQRTEGWPAGLYLAALYLREGGPVETAAVSFGGDDRLVTQYMEAEFLARISARQRVFLTRTAVLQRMSGSLCEAVLAEPGSAAALADLARSNLLLVPLDRRGHWYRYHHLFRDMLLAELERLEPGLLSVLRRRAAAWCLASDRPEEALEYFIAAGDVDEVARLVEKLALPAFRQSRLSTLQRWYGWLDARDGIEGHPMAAVWASLLAAQTGRPAEAERWADVVDRWEYRDGSGHADPDIEAWAAVLRALLCRRGVEQMLADADEAVRRFAAAGIVAPVATTCRGLALVLSGDPHGADAAFAEALTGGEEVGAPDVLADTLCERSLLAITRGDWSSAETFADRARALERQAGIEEMLVCAVQARVAWHRGDLPAAQRELVSAQRLRPFLTYVHPHLAVQARLELARVHFGLGDMAGARTLMREIDEILKRLPDLGTLVGEARELRARLSADRAPAAAGASSLTAAELRVLPMLATHLSFPEIGAEMFLSPHTVKSQAMSIYRKLGASSRNQAVTRSRELGLLEG